MAGKYGPGDVWLLLDGYDMTSWKVTDAEDGSQAETAETTGLGDTFREHSPTGVKSFEVVVSGGLYDTAALSSHEALSGGPPTTPQSADRVLCVGFESEAIGRLFTGYEGAIQLDYKIVAQNDDVSRVDAQYQGTGAREEGRILQPLSTETTDGDTESSSVDNAASSPDGGSGYLQVTALTLDTATNLAVKVRDSADDVTFGDLVSFTAVTTSPTAERVTVAGTVERYLAAAWAWTGGAGASSTATFFVGFSRN